MDLLFSQLQDWLDIENYPGLQRLWRVVRADVMHREADVVSDVTAQLQKLLAVAVLLVDLLSHVLKLRDGYARLDRGDDRVARGKDAAIHLLLFGREAA